jgi:glycosyltransferase involved in cell wall biosynthesis
VTGPRRRASRGPSVSVVIPFRGGASEAAALAATLATEPFGRATEVIVADNSDDGAAGLALPAVVVAARAERSSYHARNVGARGAGGEWLLFVDADCEPEPGLLEAYFAEPIAARTGAIAGEIVGRSEQGALAARYARSRKVMSQTDGLYGPARAVAATGNLLVRAAAFRELGGFREGIRSAGDIDFCLRLRAAGWGLDFRPGALVRHRHRESVVGLLRTFARYGAGARWLNDRHHGISPRWPLSRQFVIAWRDAARDAVRGQREEAAFRAIDALGLVAHNIGYISSNSAPRI